MSSQPSRKPLDVCGIPLNGIHLIEASAGTGKTYTITSLVLRLLLEEELPIESILAVTFTNAATAELKERIVARVEEAWQVVQGRRNAEGDPILEQIAASADPKKMERLLARAAQNSDRVAVFTIHGFAARMLKDHAFESGAREGAVLVGDQRALVQDVVADFWSSRIATLPEKEFRLVGGTTFFRALTKVGLHASSAFEVPLVELDPPLNMEDQEEALRVIYAEARVAFSRTGDELRHLLLTSPALNRNKMRPASLESDFAQYVRYFSSDEPNWGHPETDRWTQTKVSSSTKAKQPAPSHPLLEKLERLRDANSNLRIASNQMIDGLRRELCEEVHQAVRREHVREGTQSFDGLLSDLCISLRDPLCGPRLASEVRKLLPVALIDEFQDTDPVQYEIFQRIYAPSAEAEKRADTSGALYLIGDPKQSIYAFRGGDIFTYLKAAEAATSGVWTLSTSYRASPSLVRAQNALLESPRDPFGVDGIKYEPVQACPGARDVLTGEAGDSLCGIHLVYMKEPRTTDWLVHAADQIARFLAAGHQLEGRPVSPRDIAVLTRTNRQAQDLQAHLRALQIPAVMHGDRSVLEAPEALELRRVLRCLAEPGYQVLSRTALATRLLGLSADELARLDQDYDAAETWSRRLRKWSELWRDFGVARAFEALVCETELLARTLGGQDGERRMTNFRHLLELLHEAEVTQHLGVFGLLRWFEGAIADPSGHAMAAESRQLRLESDADAVTLTTAHKSKGLEYNIVFLPGLGSADALIVGEAYRYFEPQEQASRFEMRTKEAREETQVLYELESRQEALRLGYVALTRAKHHVVAFCGPVKKFSALGYLLHEREAGDLGGLVGIDARLKKLGEKTRLEEMNEIAQRCDGALQVSLLDSEVGPTYVHQRSEIVLSKPLVPRNLSESEKTSSFSAMTRDSHGLSRAAREGRDVDETVELDASVAMREKEEPRVRSAMAEFPRGARPGDALHVVFECSPFAEGSAEARRAVVERELRKRRFDESDRELASNGLEDVLATPFEVQGVEGEIRLGRLSKISRRAEMEFSLPVRGSDEPLTSELLAETLGYVAPPPHAPETEQMPRSEDSEYLTGRYLTSVNQLSFQRWSGFLRGFIDLVYEWDGKLFVVDYKSNHLGDFYGDYHRDALQGAMEEHHYLLQALLYSVAIDRYARKRVPDYRYETHFGGVQYLFLRGMHPSHRGLGVYDFRPSEPLVKSLSSLLEGKKAEARP